MRNDRLSLYPMFMKCYYHLHPMTKSEIGFAKQTIDENSNLNNFEQIVNTSELVKILVTKELFIFLVYQILGIIGLQMEIEKIFFSAVILLNLRRCYSQSKHLENLIFNNKNWPTDLRNDCKPIWWNQLRRI